MPPAPIPQAAPGLRFDRFAPRINRAISQTLQDGIFVGGPPVQAFETELASYLGVDHVITCNSGTDALFLSLLALGIGPGDEVMVPGLTAAATAVAVTQTGALPRFADVSEHSRTIDADSIEQAMTDKVKAIIVVHLHGTPAEMTPIMTLANAASIPVIEDCAQAIGARHKGRSVGTFGQTGAFSFYPTKNLGCLGDGGAIVTNDPALAAPIRSSANYGWNADRVTAQRGVNSRLDAIQANILRALLPELDAGNAERRAAAHIYDCALAPLGLTTPPNVTGAVYHQYAIELEAPQRLSDALLAAGYQTGAHYRQGVHEEPHFRSTSGQTINLPVTEYISKRLLSLPIQPELAPHQEGVITAIKGYFEP